MATTPANRATRRATPAKKAPAKKAPAPEESASSAAFSLADIDAELTEVLPELEKLEKFKFDTGEVDEDGEPIIIVLEHPGLLPYHIASSGNQDHLLAASMSDEDYERFLDLNLNTVQATTLFALWRKHYGLGSLGE